METVEPIDTLAPAPKNPRVITDDAMAGLGVSLSTFGDLGGLVLNQRTGRLVAGHQRVRALREAGATEWVRDGDIGYIEHPQTSERFSVRIVDWDERTEMAASLEANNQAIAGTFTDDALEQLNKLNDGAPIVDAAFDDLKLDDLLRSMEVVPNEPPATEGSGDVVVPFDVIVECANEEERQAVLNRLTAEGLKCRPST